MSEVTAAEALGEAEVKASPSTSAASPRRGVPGWVLGLFGLVAGAGGAGVAAGSIAGQTAAEELAQAKTRHASEVAQLSDKSAAQQAELDRMTRQLKAAFTGREALLKERDSLNAKVKAFQGTLGTGPAPAGSLLPDTASLLTQPVEVRPVFQAAEPPALRDGSRLLAARRDGVYVLTKAPEPIAGLLRGGQIRLNPIHGKAAALPAPGQGLFELEGPSRVVVESRRPVFRWKPVAGGKARYQVTVFDDKGEEAAKSGWLEGASWQPEQPLAAGRLYRWSMQVMREEGQAAAPRSGGEPAGFAIAPAAEVDKLEAARKASPDSSLTLAALSAEAGLKEEAERHLLAFRKANPGNQVAEALLAQIRLAR